MQVPKLIGKDVLQCEPVTDVITVVMTSSGRHNLIARFDLFCFNTILLRRFSCKNMKKKIEEIEDISELHLLNNQVLSSVK